MPLAVKSPGVMFPEVQEVSWYEQEPEEEPKLQGLINKEETGTEIVEEKGEYPLYAEPMEESGPEDVPGGGEPGCNVPEVQEVSWHDEETEEEPDSQVL
jgi:hypothetical protein